MDADDEAAQLLWISAAAIPTYLALLFIVGIAHTTRWVIVLMAVPTVGFLSSTLFLGSASRSDDEDELHIGGTLLFLSAMGALASLFYLLATVNNLGP